MNKKELEEQIIHNFQSDEKMMILIFAQWCVNHHLNPEEIYLRAYPKQSANYALKDAISLTVPKNEAGEIANETLLGVLSMFGNDDLAMVVSEEIKKFK
ncbi:hypothetical protein [Bacillus sp. JJ722]|uniref:hypothetical protein n=1 Tax=Bacillus sp. JJ722 TaxID=3122973 RepID=UPI003000A5FC